MRGCVKPVSYLLCYKVFAYSGDVGYTERAVAAMQAQIEMYVYDLLLVRLDSHPNIAHSSRPQIDLLHLQTL